MKNASVLNQESAYSRHVHMQDFCIEKNLSTNTPKFLEARSGDLKIFLG